MVRSSLGTIPGMLGPVHSLFSKFFAFSGKTRGLTRDPRVSPKPAGRGFYPRVDPTRGDPAHGGKWNIKNLRLLLEGSHGKEAADHVFDEINWIFVHSLKAVSTMINNDRHCFELYGFDIIIDNNLKCWLIEVNASPALSATTTSDRIMKTTVIKDTLDIVVPEGTVPAARTHHVPTSEDIEIAKAKVNEDNSNGFTLLYDELAHKPVARLQKKKSKPTFR